MTRRSHLLLTLLVPVAATSLAAQSNPRFEVGGFGTFTKFANAMALQDRIGAGGRFALHFSPKLAVELQAIYLGPSTAAGSAKYFFHTGSASLMVGGGSQRLSFFALGGVTRFDMGSQFPYDYGLTGFHGGAGFRFGLTERLALRVDGRGVFLPDDRISGGSVTHLIGSAGVAYFTKPWPGRPERPEEPPAAPIVAEPEPEPAQPQVPEAPPEQREAPQLPEVRPPVRPPVERARPARTLGRPLQGAPPLRPHGEQLEFGVFGSFTRYDRAFGLETKTGGGLRIGYFLSDRVNVEFEGSYSNPSFKTGVISPTGMTGATMAVGSVSLGFNYPFGRHSVYALGGLTRTTWGDGYSFEDNLVHGGVGARVFLTDKLALRLDGRAMYWPSTDGPPPWVGHIIGSAGLSYLASPPRQLGTGVGGRSNQWYWGGQGGLFFYKTNLQPTYYEPVIGGHWMITAKRTGMYVAYEQAFFLTEASAAIFDPSATSTGLVRQVNFSDMRRIMFGLVTHPSQKVIEPLAGLGFAMMQVLEPVPDCTSDCETLSKVTEAFDRAEDAASKAFFWLMGGIQMNYSNKLNVFGHYFLTSSGRGFLIEGNTHTIQGGVRYSLGSAKEGLTERN
jgi:hypothetical protein